MSSQDTNTIARLFIKAAEANLKREAAMASKLTLDQLHGMAGARAWGEKLAQDLASHKRGLLAWKDVDPACLLFGPPGTGKTTFVKALAATCDVPLIATSFSEWQSAGDGHLGSTMAAMAASFSEAIASRPSILFIDELDSIPKRRNDSKSEYWNAAVNALLKEFDRLKAVEGVIVAGACNHPEMLDPALVRSGRMDRLIRLTLPNAEEIEGIIAHHLTDDELRALCDGDWPDPIPRIALMCAGMSGADIEKLCREVRSRARAERAPLRDGHFFAVLDPESTRLSETAQLRAAAHEAGHALAAVRLDLSDSITASILRSNGTSGSVRLVEKPGPRTLPSIESMMTFFLAGRAAEQLVFDDPSTLLGGADATSDLAAATALATEALAHFGYSKSRGLLWTAPASADQIFSSAGPAAEEAKLLLDRAHKSARALMDSNPEYLEALTTALLDRRVLSHAEILALDNGGELPGRGVGNGRHRLATRKPAPVAQNQAPVWERTVVRPSELEAGYRNEPAYEVDEEAEAPDYAPSMHVAGYHQPAPVPPPAEPVPLYAPYETAAVQDQFVPRVGNFKRRVPKREPSWLERLGLADSAHGKK